MHNLHTHTNTPGRTGGYIDELAGTRYLKELLYNKKTYTIDLIALNLNKTIDIFKSYINIVLTFFVYFFFLFYSVVVFNLATLL